MSKRQRFGWALGMVLCLGLAVGTPVLAQTALSRVSIAEVSTAGFPEVRVRLLLRDAWGRPVPVADVPHLIELEENGAPIPFEVTEAEAGVNTLFVLDLGAGAGSQIDSKGTTRVDQMKAIVRTFAAQMGPADQIALAIIRPPEQIHYQQDFTHDPQAVAASLETVRAPSSEFSNVGGAFLALAANTALPVFYDSSALTVILLTPGPSNLGDLKEAAGRLAGAAIPVHTVLVRADEPTAQVNALKVVAEVTHGQYVHYREAGSLNELLEWIGQQHQQVTLRYRSGSLTQDERTLRVRVKGQPELGDLERYRVKVEAPQVVIDNPVNGAEYVRQSSRDAPAGPDGLAPASVEVQAHVDWPDGRARRLTSAQLLVDGQPVGAAYSNPDPQHLALMWDLKGYQAEASQAVILQMMVTDELELNNWSEPVTVKVRAQAVQGVQEAVAPGAVNGPAGVLDACAGYESAVGQLVCRAGGLAGWASLAVALVSLGMVVVFRARLAGAASSVGSAVRDVVAKVTKPAETHVGAYLTVLRGGADGTRRKIPIYINTVTKIGRDKRAADLIFDETAENSVVSREHCILSEEAGHFWIKDNASSHGTYINGQRLRELGRQELQNGDQIEVGPVERGGILLLFELDPQYQSAAVGAQAVASSRWGAVESAPGSSWGGPEPSAWPGGAGVVGYPKPEPPAGTSWPNSSGVNPGLAEDETEI